MIGVIAASRQDDELDLLQAISRSRTEPVSINRDPVVHSWTYRLSEAT
jgi:hypothetical protein